LTNNKQQTPLRVFTSNVRGIVKHWDVIKQINKNEYDILMFNEIWQVRDFENINIEDFKIASIEQRNERKGGGVIIYVRESIKFEKIDSVNLVGDLESTAIKISNTLFLSIYRPPSGNKNAFVEHLISWIESHPGKKVFISGDFKINYLSDDKRFFEKIENETGLKSRIVFPTRHTSNSCIDNTLTNIDGIYKVSNICIADHQGLISKLKMAVTKKEISKYTYREMSENNWSKFSVGVQNLRLRGEDIEEKWSNLCEDIKTTVIWAFPEKQSSVKYNFSMSQGLLKSRAKKNKLLKQYKRGEIQKEEYIRYNRIYRKLIYKENEKSFIDKLRSCDGNSKKNGEY
jgi:hypothetical protein